MKFTFNKTTNNDVFSEKISSTTAQPKKNKIVAIELTNSNVVNKFRMALVDFESTKIFSNRKVVKIERIATKLKKTL